MAYYVSTQTVQKIELFEQVLQSIILLLWAVPCPRLLYFKDRTHSSPFDNICSVVIGR